jgi:hypothetical protein
MADVYGAGAAAQAAVSSSSSPRTLREARALRDLAGDTIRLCDVAERELVPR